MVVGIGDIELATGNTQASRFVKFRHPAVRIAGSATAQIRLRGLETGVEDLDLVIVSVSNIQAVLMQRHAERMLEPHLRAGAILIAEFKQALADEGPEVAGDAEVDGADRTRLTVGHVERLPISRKAARLGHRSLQPLAIGNVFTAAPGKRLRLQRVEIEHPYLMRASHGDIQPTLDHGKVPGGIDRHRAPHPRNIELPRLLAGAE